MSSLQTFLAGKNPYVIGNWSALKNTKTLSQQIDTGDLEKNSIYDNDIHFIDGNEYRIDVLDDGTAITYCAAP
jgi:hypothetical protein